MRVTVIGGTGNVGSATVARLTRTIAACTVAGVRQLVVLSSTGAYTPGRDGHFVGGSHAVTGNAACVYSRQKAATEAVVATALGDPHVSDQLVISWPPHLGGRAISCRRARPGRRATDHAAPPSDAPPGHAARSKPAAAGGSRGRRG